jgi:hypothetical protein
VSNVIAWRTHSPRTFTLFDRTIVLLVIALLEALLGGCATWRAPGSLDDSALRARAVSETLGDVRVEAAVLSSEDSRRMLGADVNGTGVQPVWIEVENRTPQVLWFLHSGTDPNYFSPLEVAWSFHTLLGGAGNAAIDAHFEALAFRNPIPSGATRAGIVFTNPHHQTRVLNVDLLGWRQLFPLTLFLPVPDDGGGETVAGIRGRYADGDYRDLDDLVALRAALERLPCCATNRQGSAPGDPANFVIVGEFDDIFAALARRGFRTGRRGFDDDQRLFGRQPDLVGRMSGQGNVSPLWLRLWIAPLRYLGQPVFLLQVGRPMGGRVGVREGREPVLHPDVDEVRNLLIQDMLYSGGVAALGYVEGVGPAEIVQPRDSFAGSRYYTDGLRAVLFFVTRPRALSEVEVIEDWVPALDMREAAAAAEHRDDRQ